MGPCQVRGRSCARRVQRPALRSVSHRLAGSQRVLWAPSLLVEDEQLFVLSFAKALREAGFAVHWAQEKVAPRLLRAISWIRWMPWSTWVFRTVAATLWREHSELGSRTYRSSSVRATIPTRSRDHSLTWVSTLLKSRSMNLGCFACSKETLCRRPRTRGGPLSSRDLSARAPSPLPSTLGRLRNSSLASSRARQKMGRLSECGRFDSC